MTKALTKCVQSTFDDYWVKDPSTGCWNWIGAVSKGYGRMRVFGRSYKAYRFSYERANGPIPKGLHVLHKCNNGLCVNPDHLRLGTHYDNMQDKKLTYRNPSGEHAANARLNKQQVDKIRSLYASGWKQKDIGALFGISQTHVSDIVRFNTWKEERATAC